MEAEYIKIGKIVNTYGIKGEVKIYLHTDFPTKRFKQGNKLLLAKENLENKQIVEIEKARPQKNTYIVKFTDFNNINEVEKYRDYFLWISKIDQGDLDEGEYYYHQIIGCEVITNDGQGLGIVKEILSTGANDVWVVKLFGNNREILIPYIESVVIYVNIEEKKVIINPMEGLLD